MVFPDTLESLRVSPMALWSEGFSICVWCVVSGARRLSLARGHLNLLHVWGMRGVLSYHPASGSQECAARVHVHVYVGIASASDGAAKSAEAVFTRRNPDRSMCSSASSSRLFAIPRASTSSGS